MILDLHVPAGVRQVAIAGVADWHIGSPQADESKCRKWANTIEENNYYWISLADLTENALINTPGDIYAQRLSPQEQVDKVCEILAPIAKLCLGMVSGNHGRRTVKIAGLDPDAYIAANIGAPYYGARLVGVIRMAAIMNKGRRSKTTIWRIMAHHCAGGGSTPGAKINALLKMQNTHPMLDLYLGGHIHASASWDDCKFNIDAASGAKKARQRLIERHFSGCGALLHYRESYADYKNMPPASMIQVVHYLGRKVEHRQDVDAPDKWVKPYRREIVQL